MNGVVLTYDITDRESLESINFWMESMSETTDIKKLQIALVGNKSDLKDKRVISYEEGLKVSTRYNIPFFETSAKLNDVTPIFVSITDRILQTNQEITLN